MSNPLKAVAVVAAISLGALALQILPGGVDVKSGVDVKQGADDKRDESPATTDYQPGQPQARPPARSGRRSLDVPLQHAILREEKKEDSAEAAIVEKLTKPTTVEFLDLPLEDCLTFLKDYHNLNVWLDRAALTDEGVALDQPITLKLAGVSLESILHLMLQPVQLEWIIQDEVLKITTASWTNKHPETRTYNVQNLIEGGHTPVELMASITKCVAPGSWTGKDATAAIAHTGGVLVVRQSQPIHGEIARLLEELDTIADADEEEDAAKGGKNAVVSVKVYSAGEQSAEQLAECLQDFVAFTSWKNRGGEGKVRALSGALVVEQTAGVHRAIQQIIGQLNSKSTEVPAASGVVSTAPGRPGEGAPADPFRVLIPAGPPAARAPHAADPNPPGARERAPGVRQ